MKKKVNLAFLLFMFLAFVTISSGQSFEAFITELQESPVDDRQGMVNKYLEGYTELPIREGAKAHLVYSGEKKGLTVAGDFTYWSPTAKMDSIEGTNFYYKTFEFTDDARLEYKFVASGNDWFNDPGNPYTAGTSQNSELRMPKYNAPDDLVLAFDIPRGALDSLEFESKFLDNSRTIKIYIPANYSPKYNYPIIFVNDGLAYLKVAKMDAILDNLINDKVIPPSIAVFIPPVDRNDEYAFKKQTDFGKFITAEVYPFVSNKYSISQDKANRVVMGSSMGGNISLWLGFECNDIFGKVAAYSSYIDPNVMTSYRDSTKVELKIYMNHGKYDHLMPIHQSIKSFLPILKDNSYDYMYKEYPDTHSYAFWRAHIDESLEFLLEDFGNEDFEAEKVLSATPNPFENSVELSLPGENLNDYKIYIYAKNGMALGFPKSKPSSSNNITLDLKDFKSKSYIIEATSPLGQQYEIIIVRK